MVTSLLLLQPLSLLLIISISNQKLNAAVYANEQLLTSEMVKEANFQKALKCCPYMNCCCEDQLKGDSSLLDCWQLSAQDRVNISNCARKAQAGPSAHGPNKPVADALTLADEYQGLRCCARFNNIEPPNATALSCHCVRLHLTPTMESGDRAEQMAKATKKRKVVGTYKKYANCIRRHNRKHLHRIEAKAIKLVTDCTGMDVKKEEELGEEQT